MTTVGWVWITATVIAVVVVVREVIAAARQHRPARMGVVFAAAVVVIVVTVLGLVADGSPLGVLGLPRRYATYQPEPAFDWSVLLPAAGVALLVGAGIGAIRTAAGRVHDTLPSAQTRNRITAAVGFVLLVVGVASLLLR